MHRNIMYEYRTEERPFSSENVASTSDAEWKANGWHRVWADITLEGLFLVFRRERRV
jgi:hypothetical protein